MQTVKTMFYNHLNIKYLLISTRYSILACLLATTTLAAQERSNMTLEACYTLAEKNYPLIKKYTLVEKTREYSLANANKSYLPQLSLGGKATLQSEVTSLAGELPANLNINIPTLSKGQYNVSVGLNQVIWDGGAVSSSKQAIRAEAQADKDAVTADLYALRERVNNLFFGILLTQEQIKQTGLFDEQLEINYKNVESLVAGGVATGSDLDMVKVEQVKNRQRRRELETIRESYLQVLSYFTGEPISGIQPPKTSEHLSDQEIKRPELSLFNSQLSLLESKKSGVNASVMPKFSLFAEGGYGNPALNMLKPGGRFYALGGVKLAWNFGGFYTRKGDLNLIQNNQNNVENQREVFLFNTRMEALQENGEIRKIEALLTDDRQIISLKERIVEASQAKTQNGTMSVNDLLIELNSCHQAKQNEIYHRIQLQLAVYTLKHTLNQ